MTSLTLLLAQDNPADLSTMEAMRGLFSRMDMLNHPEELLTSLAQMPLIMAGIFIVVGMMCILTVRDQPAVTVTGISRIVSAGARHEPSSQA